MVCGCEGNIWPSSFVRVGHLRTHFQYLGPSRDRLDISGLSPTGVLVKLRVSFIYLGSQSSNSSKIPGNVIFINYDLFRSQYNNLCFKLDYVFHN